MSRKKVDPTNAPIHVKADQTYSVPHGYVGSTGHAGVDLILEDGSTLRFDPKVQDVWKMKFKKVTIGQNVTFDFSGYDQTVRPAQLPPPGSENGGSGGYNGRAGAPGYPGGDTAGLELVAEEFVFEGGERWRLLRHAGNGGTGGYGQNGGRGGDAQGQLHGGDGGVPGDGGQGGAGGNVVRVRIRYHKKKSAHHKHAAGPNDLPPGFTDDQLAGPGGLGGFGGLGADGGSGGGLGQRGGSASVSKSTTRGPAGPDGALDKGPAVIQT